jgi:hypothetical protein
MLNSQEACLLVMSTSKLRTYIEMHRGKLKDAHLVEGRASLLHFAAAGGYFKSIHCLLSAGVDPNVKVSNLGITPLMFAALAGSSPSMEFLLQSGADINSATHYVSEGNGKSTPLSLSEQVGGAWAKFHKHPLTELGFKRMMAILGAPPGGLTPLHLSAAVGLEETVIFLLQHGANHEMVDYADRSAEKLASSSTLRQLIRRLTQICPAKCQLEGPGLSGMAREHQPLTFHIRTKNAVGAFLTRGGLAFDVTVKGPQPTHGRVLDNRNGSYTVEYYPTAAGSYTIYVSYDGIAVGDSPFTVNVTAQDGDPAFASSNALGEAAPATWNLRRHLQAKAERSTRSNTNSSVTRAKSTVKSTAKSQGKSKSKTSKSEGKQELPISSEAEPGSWNGAPLEEVRPTIPVEAPISAFPRRNKEREEEKVYRNDYSREEKEKEHEKEILKVETVTRQWKSKYMHLQIEHERLNRDLDSLRGEVQEYQDKRARESQAKEDEMSSLVKELGTTRTELMKANLLNKHLKEATAEMTATLNITNDQLQVAMKRQHEREKDSEARAQGEYHPRGREIEDSTSVLEEKVERLATEKLELKNSLAASWKQIQELREEVSRKDAERQRLLTFSQGLEHTISDISCRENRDIVESQKKVAELERQLQHQREKTKFAESSLGESEESVIIQKRRAQEWEERAREAAAEVSRLQTSLEEELIQKRSSSQGLKMELERKTIEMEGLRHTLSQMKQELHQTRSTEEKLGELKHENEELHSQVDELAQQNADLRSLVDSWKPHVIDALEMIASCQEEVAKDSTAEISMIENLHHSRSK